MQIDNNFQTPFFVCEYMVSLIKDEPEIKTVLEPTPGKGNLALVLKKNQYCVFLPHPNPYNFWSFIQENHKYYVDVIVMNPPATPMKKAYDIFYKCVEHTNRIIALMPWLTIINSQKRTKDIMDFGLISVTHLPRSTFPGSRIQTCILNMKRGYKDKTEFKVVGHGLDE